MTAVRTVQEFPVLFFFQAEDGIRDADVTGVQTCALPISANPIYTTTGIVLSNYSESEATPYVMQMSDPKMACALGEGVDPLLYSFSQVTSAPRSEERRVGKECRSRWEEYHEKNTSGKIRE